MYERRIFFMAYIYIIKNKINNKVYIGQTRKTIEARWKKHCQDMFRLDYLLYRAMRKYGVENFYIEEIEQCSPEQLNEREIYWIAYYNSFHNGYNSTLGGGGGAKYDYSKIFETYLETKSIKETSKIWGCDKGLVTEICHLNDVFPIEEMKKRIVQISPQTGKKIKTFNSINEAATAMGDINFRRNIANCCKGKQKTAYGYGWEFEDFPKGKINYKNKKARRVCQYDKNTGELLNRYESGIAAARALGGGESQSTVILKACKSPETKSAYGYKWRYDENNN